jgi:hypothetical protein
MSLIAVTVSKTGVIRIDVFASDQDEYPDALQFHQTIASEISQFDKAIKAKFQPESLGEEVH